MFFLIIKQEYSKDAVAHVQKYLMKNEVPVNLFEVRKIWNNRFIIKNLMIDISIKLE